MNVLVGFEESQIVCNEFRKLGHDAFSNDLIDCSGNYPEYHLKMDIYDAINLKKWDLIIIHPPCTALSVSGNAHYGQGKHKFIKRLDAISFTLGVWDYCVEKCECVAMENPVGVLSNIKELPRPQYIQPHWFGDPESKKTGLWLYNLPKLTPTNILKIPECGYWNNQIPSGQNKLGPSPDRAKIRSKTYAGIAKAMAEQWTKGKI